jgi:hypothetical protein
MIALLLMTHFVADFILQSREMGKKKSSEPEWLLKHLLIQYFAFFIVLSFTDGHYFWFALLNTLIHGVIDWNIWNLYKLYAYKAIAKNPQHPLLTNNPAEPWKYWEDHWFYTTIGFDQLLHMLTLVLLAGWLL